MSNETLPEVVVLITRKGESANDEYFLPSQGGYEETLAAVVRVGFKVMSDFLITQDQQEVTLSFQFPAKMALRGRDMPSVGGNALRYYLPDADYAQVIEKLEKACFERLQRLTT